LRAGDDLDRGDEMNGIIVRPAVEADAESAALILQRSIRELCIADHQNDPDALAGWLSNKTPEHFQKWLDNPDNMIALAVDGANRMLCIGGANLTGEIILNYVSPEARFMGASTAMLAWLEGWLRAQGHTEVRLTSSKTAHDFYLARGYADAEPPQPWRGTMVSQPMRKVFD
jgi:GNAT superfamily N-acetyltransferase